MFSEKTKARLKKEAEEKKAATRMQGVYKVKKARERRQVLKEERDFENAVVSLQCRMRVKIGVKQVETVREVKRNVSATTLQRKARGRAARLEFTKQKTDVTRVQSIIRGRLAQRELKRSKVRREVMARSKTPAIRFARR